MSSDDGDDPIRYKIMENIGKINLISVNNQIDETYPPSLFNQISQDEYKESIKKINKILSSKKRFKIFCLSLATGCCLCTAGLTLLLGLLICRIEYDTLKRLLEKENKRLYRHLGFYWRLKRTTSSTMPASLQQYSIILSTLPQLSVWQPD
ncbi:hypothetical protein SNEBB_010968 [Seison nebaliae]|nr:hypothetical protein SNEBB_010968 [Seison nebaliae]